jgi:ubiquinone/menaquinone biosynthesis C-methylase UbiE
MVEMDNPFTKVSHAATIIKDSEIVDGMIVLDAGCGPGRVTIPVAKTVGAQGQVVALDIQAAMLAKVQGKVQKENLTNVEFLEAGLGSGKLKEEYFDRVLLVTVLGEIPDQESALKEIYRSLKPDGLLAITEIIFDPHFQRKSSVRKLADATGFVEHSCHGGRFAYTIILKKHKTGD